MCMKKISVHDSLKLKGESVTDCKQERFISITA